LIDGLKPLLLMDFVKHASNGLNSFPKMTFLDKLFGKKKEKVGRALSDFDKNYFTGKDLGKGAFGTNGIYGSGCKGSGSQK
jgi:hypothetical protein